MKRDINALGNFRVETTKKLAKELKITFNESDKIIRLLEAEDMLILEAPRYVDKPATVLIEDRQLLRDNLSMTSYKAGNIILNTYLDWRNIAGTITGVIETSYGMDINNPILVIAGVVSCILSMSTLIETKIGENATAIIMVLQKYKKHKFFVATERQCLQEANQILVLHGYDVMDERVFQDELTQLDRIGCIEILADGKIHLIEKVILHY